MFKSVVVGTDGSETASEAVRQAAELAQAAGATVHLVTAGRDVPESRLRRERQDTPDEIQHQVNPREDAEATLREAAEEVERAGATVETHARSGDAVDAILDVAEELEADLIVVGNKGMTGAKRYMLGSVPDKISHHAKTTVLIVRTT